MQSGKLRQTLQIKRAKAEKKGQDPSTVYISVTLIDQEVFG